jgi:hypothetical protein
MVEGPRGYDGMTWARCTDPPGLGPAGYLIGVAETSDERVPAHNEE